MSNASHKIPLAYVIGPYRDKTVRSIVRNIREAESLGIEVMQHGIFPYIPHKNTALLDGTAPDEFFLEGNLEMIRRGMFDLAVVGRGYNNSKGSLGEIQEFYLLNTPVLFREDPAFFVQLKNTVRALKDEMSFSREMRDASIIHL